MPFMFHIKQQHELPLALRAAINRNLGLRYLLLFNFIILNTYPHLDSGFLNGRFPAFLSLLATHFCHH